MLAPPPPPLQPRPDGSHFGLGWDTVLRTAAGVRYSKNGGVPGISTFVEHDPSGVDWVLLMNGTSGQKKGPKPLGHILPKMRQAIHGVEHWPQPRSVRPILQRQRVRGKAEGRSPQPYFPAGVCSSSSHRLKNVVPLNSM